MGTVSSAAEGRGTGGARESGKKPAAMERIKMAAGDGVGREKRERKKERTPERQRP